MRLKNNIYYIFCGLVGLMLCGCSSFKSSYMGSQGEDFYYVYNDNWTRSDPYYYYWTLEEGNEWYIAQNIKTKKRGVVNKSRQKLIPIIYTNLIYQNGAFIVADEAGKYYAAYDLNGNCIINFDKKFTQIEAMNKIIDGKTHLYLALVFQYISPNHSRHLLTFPKSLHFGTSQNPLKIILGL